MKLERQVKNLATMERIMVAAFSSWDCIPSDLSTNRSSSTLNYRTL